MDFDSFARSWAANSRSLVTIDDGDKLGEFAFWCGRIGACVAAMQKIDSVVADDFLREFATALHVNPPNSIPELPPLVDSGGQDAADVGRPAAGADERAPIPD